MISFLSHRVNHGALKVVVAFFCGLTALSATAQTKPNTKVPVEEKADAKSLVQMLLRQGKIIRSSEIKRGMRGVARSVFQGTKIEEFPVEALGRLEKVNGGGDIVLIRILGGPVVKRQSGIIAGMSGSPVYFGGKMLGAIAFGWGFPKEPIGGVTPITSMIETSLPDNSRTKINLKQEIAYRPTQALNLAGHDINKVVISRNRERLALAGSTMTLRPATTLLQLSGYSEKSLPRLKQALEPYQIEPIIGPSSKKTGVNPPFIEGGAIGVQLVSGDMDQTAIGTITFRMGNRILAFGHPMFGLGAASLPMTTAYIHDIFPSYERSFKFGSPVKAVGTLQQDTPFAIGGTVGVQPDMLPMTVTLRDDERQIKRVIRVRVMKDPMLTPQLVMSTAADAIESVLGQPSDKMVRISLNVELEGALPIKRHNLLYSQDPISNAAMVDLAQSISLTQNNEFARGNLKRIDLAVTVEPKRRTALLKQLVANRNKVKPGETVQISAIFEPTDTPGKTFSRTFDFKVPDNTPSGAMRIAAGPSTSFWTLQTRVGGAPPDPTTLPELVKAFGRLGAFDELMVIASTPDLYLQVDQQKLASPPPSWARLVRTTQSTGIGAYNEIDERREKLDYVILGAQLLAIPIENPDEAARPRTTPSLLPPGIPRPDTPPGTAPRPAGDMESASLLPPDVFVVNPKADFADWLHNAPFLQQIKALQMQEKPDDKPKPAPQQKDITVPPPPGSGATVPPPANPPAVESKPTLPPVVSPKPTPIPDPKTIARPAQAWVQDNGADFLQGRFEHALLTSDGQIRLAPNTKAIVNTPEPFVWSIAGDSAGNVFIGTGSNARLWKIAPAGTRTLLYSGNEVAITALTTDKTGNLYAALAPGGRLLRMATDGTSQTIFNAGQDYIWALEWDEQGRLLLGSGGKTGKIFRLSDVATRTQIYPSDANSIAQGGTLLATVPQKHIRALSVWKNDIFAGTGDDGVLLKVDASNGAAQALFETPLAPSRLLDGEVVAVAAAPEGVYFGTSGNGTIYRWTSTDGVQELYASPQQAVFAMRRTPDGSIMVATGNKGVVYLVAPGKNANDTIAARVLEADEQQALALALVPDSDLLIGTGNSGAAYRLSLRERGAGTFTSTVLDAKSMVRWGALRFTGRGVTLETRSGNTNEPDKTWNPWQAALINDLGEWRVASPDARFLQYRARLDAASAAAALIRVEILYRSRNSPPIISVNTPKGGEFWKGKKKFTWTGKDPDADSLRYDVFISADQGTNWKLLERARETADYELDTSKWADGTYIVKIKGDDEVRNPEDPQHDESISLPFTIDNTPPRLEVALGLKNNQLWLTGVAVDGLSPIAGAEWRFVKEKSEAKAEPKADDKKEEAKGDWQAVAAVDGLFDSRREAMTALISLPELAKGEAAPRKIEVRVEDAAGNSALIEISQPGR